MTENEIGDPHPAANIPSEKFPIVKREPTDSPVVLGLRKTSAEMLRKVGLGKVARRAGLIKET